MRLVIMTLCALTLCGCAGMKLGTGYRFDTQEFFLSIEKPLDGFKK